jgi:IclR family transcriptional regulator, pca regulon regulatory protein
MAGLDDAELAEAQALAAALAPAQAPPGAVAPRDRVGGLEKGLLVSEVARRAGLTRAAARRSLLTLMHLGYVHHDGKLFSLNARVLRLGQSYMHSSRLPRTLQPALSQLALTLQEGSSAGVLDRDDVISVAAATPGRLASATLQPGTRVPAFCTANGRVLVAALAPLEAAAWVQRQKLRALTPHTVLHKDRLAAEIERARTNGYALVDQELELGLRTVSVPLRNFRGDTVAAMNVSAHATRMGVDDLLEKCLPLLLQAQAQLRQLL